MAPGLDQRLCPDTDDDTGASCSAWGLFCSHGSDLSISRVTLIFNPTLKSICRFLHRLDNPGYLSRDLIATNPHVAYTIYDEIALFFHRTAHIDFEHILVCQQLLFRAAAMFGVYLMASSAGFRSGFSVLIAAIFNLGASLLGPASCWWSMSPFLAAMRRG